MLNHTNYRNELRNLETLALIALWPIYLAIYAVRQFHALHLAVFAQQATQNAQRNEARSQTRAALAFITAQNNLCQHTTFTLAIPADGTTYPEALPIATILAVQHTYDPSPIVSVFLAAPDTVTLEATPETVQGAPELITDTPTESTTHAITRAVRPTRSARQNADRTAKRPATVKPTRDTAPKSPARSKRAKMVYAPAS